MLVLIHITEWLHILLTRECFSKTVICDPNYIFSYAFDTFFLLARINEIWFSSLCCLADHTRSILSHAPWWNDSPQCGFYIVYNYFAVFCWSLYLFVPYALNKQDNWVTAILRNLSSAGFPCEGWAWSLVIGHFPHMNERSNADLGWDRKSKIVQD